MRWLICTNGEPRFDQAAIFATGLVDPVEDEVVLLGIQEKGDSFNLDESLKNLEQLLDKAFVKRVVEKGHPVDLIEKTTETERVEIVVYGSRGRRGISRLLLGSVAAHLEHNLTSSLLIIREEPETTQKILTSISLSPESQHAVELSGKIARRTGAFVTLLHVMSQLPVTDEANTAPLQMTAEEAIAQGTLEGKHLQQALSIMENTGVPAQAALRHGLVLDEVVAELNEGNYQLLIIGAHRMPPDLPLANLLVEDVADMILMHTSCPVLIAS